MKRVRVLVSGRVQGVFYRATCAERARQLGVGGWVRNLPDGRVEAVFEGPDDRVDAIVEWCRQGPPFARVEHMEVHAEEPRDEPGFRVR